MSGTFITFEGGEGGGKSTHIKRLEKRLAVLGKTVITTREPGGSNGAEAIRSLLVTGDKDRWTGLTEAFLHSAARHEHVARVIGPALKDNKWVLCDRFYDSTMAYQGYAQDLGRENVEALTKIAIGDLVPDLTLILDLPVQVGLGRAASRNGDENRYEEMGTAFHQRLRAAFKDIALREPDRCVVINADQAIEEVEDDIWAIVKTRFNL